MNTGSPSWLVTQVSSVAGAGNFSLAGGLEQPGALQGGQGQQEPGQRVPAPGGEDWPGALAEQPPPGQRPLPVPGYRPVATQVPESDHPPYWAGDDAWSK
jgi:hypothetical protein